MTRIPHVRAALLTAAAVVSVPLLPVTATVTAAPAQAAAAQPWPYCGEIDSSVYDTPPPADPGRYGYGVLPAITGVTCLINQERSRLGLERLADNAELREAANQHVTAALAQKWWGPGADPHRNPQVSGSGQEQIVDRIQNAGYCLGGRSWAGYEITYNGWGPGHGTPRAAVDWWLNVSTQGHAEIIRDPSLTEIGVAPRGGAADPAGSGFSDAGTYVVTLGRCER